MIILVFANVIPPSIPRAPFTSEPHEPRARLVLKVPSPAYSLGVEQVYYRGYIPGYSDVLVVVEAEVVAPYRGDVVGLGGVRLAVVFREEDALALEVDDVWVVDYLGEVLSVVVGASVACDTYHLVIMAGRGIKGNLVRC